MMQNSFEGNIFISRLTITRAITITITITITERTERKKERKQNDEERLLSRKTTYRWILL